MNGNKNNITKFMRDYVSTDEDGFEYISTDIANKMIRELPSLFDNVLAYTQIGKETGLKFFCVRTMSGRKDIFSAYILDENEHELLNIKRDTDEDATNNDIDEARFYSYTITDNGVTIDSYNGYDFNEITIPDKINGIPVVEIGSKAFMNCKAKSIIMPNTIRKIGEYAFSKCAFDTIRLSEALEVICQYAFSSVPLIELEIPSSVKRIEKRAFNCYEMKKLVFNEGLLEIGEFAFGLCRYIHHLILPNSLKKIDDLAFCGIGESLTDGIHKAVVSVRIGSTTDIISSEHLYPNKKEPQKASIFSNKSYVTDIVIYCHSGSFAEKYADEFGYKTAEYNNFIENNNVLSNDKINWIEGISYSRIRDGIRIDYIDNDDFSEVAHIPSSIENHPVVELACEALLFRKEKNLILPKLVKRIGDYAFSHCNTRIYGFG